MQRYKWMLVTCCGWAMVGWVQCQRQLTEFAGLKPETAYVGDESCQPCHKQIFASYRETGMGRSLYRPDTSQIIERFGQQEVVYDPKKDFSYYAYWQGNEMRMVEFRLNGTDTLHKREERVDYIVGSGHQTRSYLMERNGYLMEMPITWYVYRQIWDLSPGYEEKNSRFDRAIGEECLACHTGAFERQSGSQNKYTAIGLGIDCERCHGPGSEHVRRTKKGQLIDVGVATDYSIVNPAKLEPNRHFDVCQQCHLQGIVVPARAGGAVRDFRPGMALTEVFDVFIELTADPEAFGIASHAERLKQSACFIRSEGKLTCTTCHDPHRPVAALEQGYFNQACQTCHTQGMQPLCGAPAATQLAMNNDCSGCHMPAGGARDIPHVRFHDHKIRVVRPLTAHAADGQAAFLRLISGARSATPPVTEAEAWLRYYAQQHRDPLHLSRAAQLLPPGAFALQATLALFEGRYQDARQLNEKALSLQPEHPELLSQQGEILEALGEWEAAFNVFEALFTQEPLRLEAGFKAAVCLLKARRGQPDALERAGHRFRELLVEKPFDPRYIANLAFVEMNQGRLLAAEAGLVQALRLDPDYPVALENMAQLQWMKGNAASARLYVARLQKAAPDHPSLAALAARASQAR